MTVNSEPLPHYGVSHPTTKNLGHGCYTISVFQPIGDAASELANLLKISHGEALGILQEANRAGVSTSSKWCVTNYRDEISYSVTLNSEEYGPWSD